MYIFQKVARELVKIAKMRGSLMKFGEELDQEKIVKKLNDINYICEKARIHALKRSDVNREALLNNMIKEIENIRDSISANDFVDYSILNRAVEIIKKGEKLIKTYKSMKKVFLMLILLAIFICFYSCFKFGSIVM